MGVCLTEAWSDNMKLVAVLSLASSEWSWLSLDTDTAVGTVDTGTDMALDTVMDTVDTARGLLMLKLSLDMDTEDTVVDTVVMVIEATDMAMDTARGLLMLRLSLLLLLSLDMDMVDTDMDMAMLDTDMEAMDIVLDMERGLLRLPLDTTNTVDTDIMDITDTMAMDMDMARGQLRPPLDTTDIMDITDTTVMDMDMDTMVRKERYQTGFPVCLTSRIQ